MLIKEFQIFSTLLEKVYQQAFKENLKTLPKGKAQLLCWAIQKRTGELLNQQSLQNYVEAIHTQNADHINPTATTLGVLVNYINRTQLEKPKNSLEFSMCWFNYRRQSMAIKLSLAS